MRLWQRTFLLSSLICVLILYGCMFGVSAPAISATLRTERLAAQREEKAIAESLNYTMERVSEERRVPAMESFLTYYRDTGLFFLAKKDGNTLYDTLPSAVDKKPGSMGYVRLDGILYQFISDSLPMGYDLLYLKDASELDRTLSRQLLTSAVTGSAVALLMTVSLYLLLYRINLPVSRLAHEMRTPLTIMKGYAETIRDIRLTEEQKYSAASYIAEESTRLAGIATRLLAVHNPKEEKSTFVPVSIPELFRHVQNTYPQVTFETTWQAVFGDPAMLSSLFNNLVDNAVKASDPGMPVELKAEPNRITVTDHGKGMTDQELRFVNHPPKLRALHEKGGIGIPLCHQIANAHGARLSFQRGTDGGIVAIVAFYNSEN